MSQKVFKPDTVIPVFASSDQPEWDGYKHKIFLAGSIENGTADDWQAVATNELNYNGVAIYNPRRDKWNANLTQTPTNEEFRYQVTWEQMWLEKCDIVLMNLLPETYSPISLLELGQLSTLPKKIKGNKKDKHTVVVCPKTFWRRGNVEMVCMLYKIALYETLEQGIAHIKTLIQLS